MSSTYNTGLSYEENYAAGPVFEGPLPDLVELNAGLPATNFLGYTVNSTLGIPAGPLLNSQYIKLYAQLGWDVLTYKTVRTKVQRCHPFPNVRPVGTAKGWYKSATAEKPSLYTLEEEGELADLSITNSFGMPSQAPEIWRADVAQAKKSLQSGQVLVVSVVGTAQPGGTLGDLAADFAQAASWTAEAGADVIEANLSCPNVQSSEGSLYQSPAAVGQVAKAIADALAGTKRPFLLKIGYLENLELIKQILEAAHENGAAGFAAINTIPAKVYTASGEQALPGTGRLVSGICGAGIKEAGLEMAERLIQTRRDLGLKDSDFAIVGVGGVTTPADVFQYQNLGVSGVQSGTGAMWHPQLAAEVKRLLKPALV